MKDDPRTEIQAQSDKFIMQIELEVAAKPQASSQRQLSAFC